MEVVEINKNTKSTYKNLLVWQKSVDLATEIYKVTANFPKSQQYGIVSQLERSAVSVASNIAEGAGRKGKNEFVYHIGVARGSLYELETQLIIAHKVGFLSGEISEHLSMLIQEIAKMLNALKRSLE
jgi:four helix bundle protein